MEELFNEQEIKSEKINNEPLAKVPGYTSEQYLDYVLDFFYEFDRYNSKKNFSDFKIIDERSLQKNSDIEFIKKIAKYKFNMVERYLLLYLSVLKLKKFLNASKKEIISTLIEKKIAKPSMIVKLLSENSKLFKSKCIKKTKRLPFEDEYIEIDEKLFNILLIEKNKTKKKRELKIKPNEIYEKLNKYIIGQDSAIKNISAAVYEHIIKCKLNKNNGSKDKLDKTNTLIIGPTGTGKTFICNTLSKILDIPIYVADASQMTESGYIGLSPNSIFVGLEKLCEGKIKNNKFPISIIYIDEIDKIALNKNGNHELGNKGIQEEFLKMFESDKYFYDGGKYSSPREYDISNIMFILGGAFSGLKNIIEQRINTKKEKKIGFFKDDFTENNINTNILQQTTTEDLIEYGFMHEFIGRLSNKVILNPLSKQDLINILTLSQNNVISQYKQIFKEAGIKLDVLDETIEYVAEKAIQNSTGARGLKSILSNVLNKTLFDAVSNEKKDFTLTPKYLQVY